MERQLKSLIDKLEQGEQAGREGRHDEAFAIFDEIRAQCASLGFESAQVFWFLAVACDYRGEHIKAMSFIRKMLTLDPLSSNGRASFQIISNNLRKGLCDPNRPPDAPDTEKLYALLLETGEADSASHVAMARHQGAAQRVEQAIALLEAVTRLTPTCEEAWEELQRMATQIGRTELAKQAQLALATIRSPRATPFAMPQAAAAA